MSASTTYGAGMEQQLAPLILVDVDGVLNPSKPGAGGYRRQWVFPAGVAHRLLLDPGHGRMLSELAAAGDAELVWATYWRNRANKWIAPRIGLPSLRFVPIPSHWGSRARLSLGHWKALHVAAWIGQTPFVWFEDDPNVPSCLTQQPGLGRHLTVTVDPVIGLTRHHIEQAWRWLDDLRAYPDHHGGTAESSPH
jgi:HAD domain in Swiss Army Knife RNA repair proteins